jgi:hypothetical protein
MNTPTEIQRVASELHLHAVVDPFHAANGIELQRWAKNSKHMIGIGYIKGPNRTVIYRRVQNKRDTVIRNKLWFLQQWLPKPDQNYIELSNIPTLDFTEDTFLKCVREEFADSTQR